MKYVISLGGSIINPGEIQTRFLRDFVKLIKARTKKGDHFFIITGGGFVTRQYQRAAKSIAKVSDEDLDWLGIAPTKVNAELVRALFGTAAYEKVLSDPTKKVNSSKKVVLFSGEKPGQSTDTSAVKVARANNVATVINLSNIDYVYTADPKRNKKARKITEMSWPEFTRQFGKKWKPGANFPFDPIAAQIAKKNKIGVVVADGKRLSNLKNLLAGKKFQGTVIE